MINLIILICVFFIVSVSIFFIIRIRQTNKEERAMEFYDNKVYEFIPISYPLDSPEHSLLQMINNTRDCNRLKFLKPEAHSTYIAALRCKDVIRLYNFTKTPKELKGLGICNIGENIAFGYLTIESAYRAFIYSDEHYDNIINPIWDYCGIAVVTDKSNKKWCCIMFGKDENKRT